MVIKVMQYHNHQIEKTNVDRSPNLLPSGVRSHFVYNGSQSKTQIRVSHPGVRDVCRVSWQYGTLPVVARLWLFRPFPKRIICTNIELVSVFRVSSDSLSLSLSLFLYFHFTAYATLNYL